jgi:hypothetical protein
MKVFLFISLFLSILVQAQSTQPAKVSTFATVGAGNSAVVNQELYMWSVGEPVIFTGGNAEGFATQGFHQPMICRAFPQIAAFNQTSCLLPYELQTQDLFDKYTWYLGNSVIASDNDAVYNPVTPGRYRVVVGDSTGCTLPSNSINVDLSAKNIIPIVTAEGEGANDTLLISTFAKSYQWYVITPSDGVHRAIVGGTSQTYRPYYNGTYYVKINTDEDCIAYSDYFVLNNSDFESINRFDFDHTDSSISLVRRPRFFAHKLRVYPIPSTDKVTVHYESPERNKVLLLLYDVNGVVVDTKEVFNKLGTFKTEYTNESLPSGKYTLSVIDGEKKSSHGFIFY